MITYEKVDDTTLKVTKPADVSAPAVDEYKIEFLKQQELDILKQRNDYIEARDKELAEVRELITKAEGLGIVTELSAETLKATTLK